ncbi:hypothetical protein D3C73_996810 [compost metagenome]
MTLDQPVEDIHVAKHQAGLFRCHDDVFATQLFAGAGGHEQRNDLVEILGRALAQVAGRAINIGQPQFGLLDRLTHARLRAGVGHGHAILAQHRLTTLAAGRLGAIEAAALGLLLGTAKQEDRSDQQQAGGQDADAQQCRVGHSLGSPASSFR